MPHRRQSGERILSRGAALVHRLSKPVGMILARPQLRHACRLAGTPDYTPHAFRRAWATGAAAVLPCWEAALGGGWRGTERFDTSYVTPSRAAVWAKLSGLGMDDAQPRAEPARADDVPAHAL